MILGLLLIFLFLGWLLVFLADNPSAAMLGMTIMAFCIIGLLLDGLIHLILG